MSALENARAVRCRLSQATPRPKPIAPPIKLNARSRPTDLFRFAAKPKAPMHVPIAAGVNALRTESLRYGVRGFPFKNASRPERVPSSPASRTFRPYLTSDSTHCCTVIIASPIQPILELLSLLDHSPGVESVRGVTGRCDCSHKNNVRQSRVCDAASEGKIAFASSELKGALCGKPGRSM